LISYLKKIISKIQLQ